MWGLIYRWPQMHEPSQQVRILVVDNFEPFRRYMCRKLQARPEWRIVAEASDGLQAVQKAEELKPDLILLDIGMPLLNGIEATERISTVAPGATVLFVSQQTDADLVAAALSNGAMGYVLKANADRELLPAVEAVLEGRPFVSSGVMRGLLDRASPNSKTLSN